MNNKHWLRLLLGGGLLIMCVAVVPTVIEKVFDTPAPADAAPPEGPAPGDPGFNPCLNREAQNEATTWAYYQLIGENLKKYGDPNFAEFDPSDPAWIQKAVDTTLWNTGNFGESNRRDPSEGFNALTYWCPGWDVTASGDQVERKPELVKDKPLHYAAHKEYWVLFENDDVIVAILTDCHNLVIITKTHTPPPAPTTLPPPTAPPTTAPPSTSTPPTTPPTTQTTMSTPTTHVTPTTTPVTVPLCPDGVTPVPPNGVCPKDPALDVNVNPQVPPQVQGPGSTPVGVDPGPPVAPTDTPTGCNGSCPTTVPPATTASSTPSPGSGTSGDGTPLPTGGTGGVSNPEPAGIPATPTTVRTGMPDD